MAQGKGKTSKKSKAAVKQKAEAPSEAIRASDAIARLNDVKAPDAPFVLPPLGAPLEIKSTRGDPSRREATIDKSERTTATVRVELEGGAVLFTTLNTFLREHAPEQNARGEQRDVIVFPTRLRSSDAVRGGGVGALIERISVSQVGGVVADAVDWFKNHADGSMQEQLTRYVLGHAIDAAAATAAWTLCYWREQKTLQGIEKQGIVAIDLQKINAQDVNNPMALSALTPESFKQRAAGGKPILLFLHGTASSTSGSFDGLYDESLTTLRTRLVNTYGDRVFGFEHRSLTQSPAQNALDLVETWLPKDAVVHLVSHSRGGMIGELLTRCGAKVDEKIKFAIPKLTDAKAGFFDSDFLLLGDHPDKVVLERLATLFENNTIKIERFVRVACPARGTTLASSRLDHFLSLVFNAANLATPIVAAPAMAALATFCQALIATRTDPSVLPGLEAMQPTAPLVRVLNNPIVSVAGSLHAIAGDYDAEKLFSWAGIKEIASTIFYREDNDWVVQTAAMDGGVRRRDGMYVFRVDGEDITHFRYFQARRAVEALVEGLQGDSRHYTQLSSVVATRGQTRGTRGSLTPPQTIPKITKPVVFVLPGIMGSELAVGSDTDADVVWLDYVDLLFGQLDKLAISEKTVRAVAPLSDTYGELCDFLLTSHHVVPFPYDWRKSLVDSAERLANELGKWCAAAKAEGQPIRIIAHSLGGLVCRTMILNHGKVWDEVCAQQGARLVMLGTPNRGSHSIAKVLTGRDSLVKWLSVTNRNVYQIISNYPGVIELLPSSITTENWFDPSMWNTLSSLEPNAWNAPPSQGDNSVLAQTRQLRKRLDQQLETGIPHAEKLLYVAGCAEATPYRIDMTAPPATGDGEVFDPRAQEQFGFLDSSRGDGRVTWSSGRIAGVKTWWVDAAHGDLPKEETAFQGYLGLLRDGTTQSLSSVEPDVSTRSTRGFATAVSTVPATLARNPDPADLVLLATGGTARRAKSRRQKTHVVVRNGTLDYARHPLLIGHYTGDGLEGPERRLDDLLHGSLSELIRLGVYPQTVGNHAIVFSPSFDEEGHPELGIPGAIVVGMGSTGEVTVVTLSQSIAQAILEYAHRALDRARNFKGWVKGKSSTIDLELSALLVGMSSYGLTVTESVTALLRAVRDAQSRLEYAKLDQFIRIANLEIIEWMQDRALDAAHAALRIGQMSEFASTFQVAERMERIPGARARLRFGDEDGRYQRLRIIETPDGRLSFALIANRARIEVTHQVTQIDLIDQLLTDAVHDVDGEFANTLFELLVPHELKDRLGDGADTVLLLNGAAARYPWEVLLRARKTLGRTIAIATDFKLVRQLEMETFRLAPIASENNSALVIGDPDLGEKLAFRQLPGARAEGQRVADQLKLRGYAVDVSLGERATTVISRLFKRSYRILHIAAHGAFEWVDAEKAKDKTADGTLTVVPKTGIVLGAGIFLTASEIEALPYTPEVVFINCCYSGQGRTLTDRNPEPVSKIAASVAEHLMRIGVRAVVATGWAIDDTAALRFAQVFYDQMLSGAEFAYALRIARKEIASLGGDTWGAYQAYGDPHFNLNGSDDTAQEDSSLYVSCREVEAQLLNSLSAADVAKPSDAAKHIAKLDDLTAKLRSSSSSLLSDGAAMAALGRAYSNLASFSTPIAFRRAIDWLRNSLIDATEVDIQVVEELAHVIGRCTVFGCVRGWDKPNDPIVETEPEAGELKGFEAEGFPFARKLVHGVIQISPNRWQSHALLGSLDLREAWTVSVAAGDAKAKIARVTILLDTANKHFGKPIEGEMVGAEGGQTYLLSARAVSQSLLQFLGAVVPANPITDDDYARLKATSLQAVDRTYSNDFWGYASKPDARLALLLLAKADQRPAGAQLAPDNEADTLALIMDAYRAAKRKGVSRKNWASVLDRLEALRDLLALAAEHDAKKEKLLEAHKTLQDLYDFACAL